MCNLDSIDESRDKFMISVSKTDKGYVVNSYGIKLCNKKLNKLEEDFKDILNKNFMIEKFKIHFTILNSQ